MIDRKDIKARLAINDEGPRVAELAASAGFVFTDWEISWDDIHPHWLVADHRGELLGCLQVCYGRPVGRLEMLAFDPSLEKDDKRVVIEVLIRSGFQVLKDYGAQASSSMIPFELTAYTRWLKRRGGVNLGSGNIIMKVLR